MTDAVPLAHRLRLVLEMVRFSHSVFALPFALLSLVLAAGGVPSARVLGLVVVAMVAARSAAMAFNRLLDRDVDAENPRTAGRHLVVGSLSVGFAWAFTAVCVGVFVLCAGLLNPTALALSPVVLAVLLGYSTLKRFTSGAHFGVGLALGLSPLGAWVAGAGGLVGDLRVPLVLGAAVLLWVAGFDVIYACQDADVDRRLRLHSIPARLGVPRALRVAALCHLLCIAAFVAVAPLAGLRWPYLVAVGVAAALLAYEHAIVSPEDLSKVNVAFFNVNGVVALLVGAAGIADRLAG
ncbi:MAG: UbiA family prenyltransferase [Planctomycetes bacterium]|nr:UbiA family prenyltransferase [Planctomycetota bacterium]